MPTLPSLKIRGISKVCYRGVHRQRCAPATANSQLQPLRDAYLRSIVTILCAALPACVSDYDACPPPDSSGDPWALFDGVCVSGIYETPEAHRILVETIHTSERIFSAFTGDSASQARRHHTIEIRYLYNGLIPGKDENIIGNVRYQWVGPTELESMIMYIRGHPKHRYQYQTVAHEWVHALAFAMGFGYAKSGDAVSEHPADVFCVDACHAGIVEYDIVTELEATFANWEATE